MTYDALYKMKVWSEQGRIYATCPAIEKRSFVDIPRKQRYTFESRLCHHMHVSYNLLAQDIKLRYCKGKVELQFTDDESLIIAKMVI